MLQKNFCKSYSSHIHKIQTRIPDYQSENEIIIDELEKKIEAVQLDMDSDD